MLAKLENHFSKNWYYIFQAVTVQENLLVAKMLLGLIKQVVQCTVFELNDTVYVFRCFEGFSKVSLGGIPASSVGHSNKNESLDVRRFLCEQLITAGSFVEFRSVACVKINFKGENICIRLNCEVKSFSGFTIIRDCG